MQEKSPNQPDPQADPSATDMQVVPGHLDALVRQIDAWGASKPKPMKVFGSFYALDVYLSHGIRSARVASCLPGLGGFVGDRAHPLR